MDEHHHRFIVHPTGKDDLAYIGWEVATEEAVHSMAAQLTAAGVAVRPGAPEEAEARRVAGFIKFHDPSGIASEIFYGPLVTFDTPFQSPRPISGFQTGERGLGHCVVFVDDFDRSLRFYRDVLGMRISDFVRFSLAPGETVQALSCTATRAIIPWPSRRSLRLPGACITSCSRPTHSTMWGRPIICART